MCVAGIIIIGDDTQGIEELKNLPSRTFAWYKKGISLSQRKYALDILEETSLIGTKLVEAPMDTSVNLCVNQG